MMSALPQNEPEVFCKLIEVGAELDQVDLCGWTALHHAAGAGRPLMVEVGPRTLRAPSRELSLLA